MTRNKTLTHSEITAWLREPDPARLETLWQIADDARRKHVGEEVHLRGLIELSNHCVRRCAYCGLGADNPGLRRYRMTEAEVMECVRQAVGFGYGTVVMQSGEDYGIKTEFMAGLIRRIKSDTPLAVTLSLGERPDDDLAAWRNAGADRYLLRFETSNRQLYDRIHPPHAGQRSDRIAILHKLRDLGYETGSGVMIGLPGQTFDMLAADIELFLELDLDMIGVGPYIAHGLTRLGQQEQRLRAASGEQVPNSELMTYKVVALTRIICPLSNIPSTTALATLNRSQGRELGLARGANVVMPNLTPSQYRALYEIYPAKVCIDETADACHACMKNRILSLGRKISAHRGDSLNYAKVWRGRAAASQGP